MATRKKASRSKGAPKLLSTSKVLRIVQKLGADPARFLKLYAEDRTRSRTQGSPPSREQIGAVRAFTKSGNVGELMKATGLKTPGAALNLVGRVSRHTGNG